MKRKATPAQQAASRRNGTLFGGRRKTKSIADSLLANRTTAQTVCLPAENQDAFHALLESFQRHFSPATDIEFLRVETLASIEWRLRRLWDSERSILAAQMQATHAEQPSPQRDAVDSPSALLGRAQRTLGDSSRAIDKLQIQEGRLIRAYDRTLAQLHALRKNRASKSDNSLIPIKANRQKAPESERLAIESEPETAQ